MSIFTQFFRSMYSTKEIASYRNQGIGKTILYILLLSLISAIPTMIYMSVEIQNNMNSLEQIYREDQPSFEIADGVLKMNQEDPFIKETDDFVFIVEGSNKFNVKDIELYRNALALLKEEVIIVTDYQSQSIDYSLFEGMLVSEKDLFLFIDAFESMMPIILIIMNIILFLMISIVSFVEIFVLALFGLIIKNILGLDLKYRHSWILTAYSITIPTIFFTIMSALKIQVMYGGSLNWFVTTIILYFVFKEVPRPNLKS